MSTYSSPTTDATKARHTRHAEMKARKMPPSQPEAASATQETDEPAAHAPVVPAAHAPVVAATPAPTEFDDDPILEFINLNLKTVNSRNEAVESISSIPPAVTSQKNGRMISRFHNLEDWKETFKHELESFDLLEYYDFSRRTSTCIPRASLVSTPLFANDW